MSASSSSLPSPSKARPPCAHFGLCGGCAWQDRIYDEQLRLKAEKVLAALSCGEPLPQPTVHGSPDIWRYRNKMEFSFGDVYPPRPEGPGLKLGLKPKGRWYEILDIGECLLASAEACALLGRLRAWAAAAGAAPYNIRRKTGFLRHLVLRETRAGERMVVLVTAEGSLPEASFLAAVKESYPASTVLWGINAKESDVAVSDRLKILDGPGHVTETLRFGERELKFRISPHSFFQTNTTAANLLYGLIREWAAAEKPRTILDLYCGGGGITLTLADLCAKVVGVESCSASVADANANARRNGLAGAEFYDGAVEVLLPALLALGPQVVVCDPPRAGMHAGAAEVLAASGPGAVIYVSCNPLSLARDLAVLTRSYRVERLAVVDLFPHTEHVETLALLRRVKK
ncbi:MAG: 23S rRNA (uracil(1939)-C(5))-methyltransferase RlmD [Elusimicrobia bacterium]|nr:23S rRNA (uracil(1939)-C(5))-methyltransferase RlmD [Elusimicrobiota bacterium]